MSRRDWIIVTDSGLLLQAKAFLDGISVEGSYGVPPETVADFEGKVAEYETCLLAATTDGTRGQRTIFLKNQAKKELVAMMRKIGMQINNTISVTDEQRQLLGLTIHADPSPIAPPSTKPFIRIRNVDGRTVTIQLLADEDTRGKPTHCTGAIVFSHVGESAPASVHDWDFASTVTRTKVVLPFQPSETGDTAWVSAFWQNGKGESGPACEPVKVNLPAGGVLPKEVNEAV